MTTPTLLLLKGPMGVGKSTFAKALGKRTAWCVTDKDCISDVLVGHLEAYASLSYDILFAFTEDLLGQGFNVIVDSPLRTELGYLRAVRLAEKYSASLKVLELHCSNKGVWRNRLESREFRAAQLIQTWAEFEMYWETAKTEFDYPVNHSHLLIDTSLALSDNLETVKRWLNI